MRRASSTTPKWALPVQARPSRSTSPGMDSPATTSYGPGSRTSSVSSSPPTEDSILDARRDPTFISSSSRSRRRHRPARAPGLHRRRAPSDPLAVLESERLLLFPADAPVRDIAIQPSVIVPVSGEWTASPAGASRTPTNARPGGGRSSYGAHHAEQLQDSPIIAGESPRVRARSRDLGEALHRHHLRRAGRLRPAPGVLAEISNLVREADAAYAWHHYHVYHLLLALSDVTGGRRPRHGQSLDNGVGGKRASPTQLARKRRTCSRMVHPLLERQVRRPLDSISPTSPPCSRANLSFYEGMTQFLGNMLTARADLKSHAQIPDLLAPPPRTWTTARPRLAHHDDAAIAASILPARDRVVQLAPRPGLLPERDLLWLDADTLIRQLTDDRKSLTDFLQIIPCQGRKHTAPSCPTTARNSSRT